MADAPQVVQHTDYPEAYQNQKHEQAAPQHYADSPSQHASPGPADALKQPYIDAQPRDIGERNKILGLRRRNFWIILIGILVIGGAIIGGSVGGSLAVQNSKSKSEASPTPTSLLPTASQASSTPSSTPGVQGTLYTPLPFSQITSINITCPSPTYASGTDMPGFKSRYTYNCQNSRNIANGDSDLASFTTYTLEQCVDACSQWNEMGRANVSCVAAVVAAKLAIGRASGNGANCWLKSDARQGARGEGDYTAAVLIT